MPLRIRERLRKIASRGAQEAGATATATKGIGPRTSDTASSLTVTGEDSGECLTTGENLGLNVVHDLDSKNILLDIVFVHGLIGNAFSTWHLPAEASGEDAGLHWPKDLLKNDIPHARISLFGYDANVASFWGGASQNRLANHAENLLGELTGLREDTDTQNREIIFVAHSLGGLVVKRALQLSESNAERHLRQFEASTAGILFLGTPHLGSDFAPFAKSVGFCLGVFGKRVNLDILDTLKRDSQVLLDVEDWFANWRRRRAEAENPIQITCFYEELAMRLVGKVVEEYQAKIPGYSLYGIHSDHRNMTKFTGVNDPGYKAVRREIRRWIKIVGEANQQKANPQNQEHARAIKTFLSKLDACPYEDQKNVNARSIPGTCEWFTKHELFRRWNENDRSALLWVSADPGSGKSVLARYMIEHFLPLPGKVICYFFFKDGFPDQQSILNAIRTLLHQLCLQDPSLVDKELLDRSERQGFFDSFDNLWKIFVELAHKKEAGEIVCVLDALDECEQVGFLRLSEKIRSLSLEPPNDTASLKILLTSRPYESVRWEFQELEELMPTIHLAGESETEVKKISKEIDLFVQSRIQSISRKRKLTGVEEEHLLELMTAVPNRTYLWVSLTLSVIERMHGFTRGSVIKSIDSLPQTVDEAYERILGRSPDPPKALKALHLIIAARRPLNLVELQTALIMNDTDNSDAYIRRVWEPDDRFADSLRNLCGLLVVIIDNRVHFLHQTVREFLMDYSNHGPSVERERNPSAGYAITAWKHSILARVADGVMAQACIWYLTSLASPVHEFADLEEYATSHWPDHFRMSDAESTSAITQSALELCRGDCAQATLAKSISFGLHQVVNILIWDPDIDMNGLVEENEGGNKTRTPLGLAAELGFTEIVKMLLSLDHILVDARDPFHPKKTPLHHAAINGHSEIVQLLLDTNKINVNAMLKMASPWYEGVEDEIWASATNLELGEPWTDTALCWAARNGHGAVIRLLLEHPDLDLEAVNPRGETALTRAESRGDEDIMALLLATGKVDPNIIDRCGRSLIERSVQRGQTRIVRILLGASKINPDSQFAAFTVAVACGNQDMVEAFFSLGEIDINAVNEFGITALMIAARHGEEKIVNLILHSPGLDINIQANDTDHASGLPGDTALIYTARERQAPIVRLLLEAGADTQVRNMDGDTALAIATANLDLATVIALLEGGHFTIEDIESAQADISNRLNQLNKHDSASSGSSQTARNSEEVAFGETEDIADYLADLEEDDSVRLSLVEKKRDEERRVCQGIAEILSSALLQRIDDSSTGKLV